MKLNYEYECILSILIENQPSILTRVVGLLTRRGFVIESFAVGSTEYESISRIILVLTGNLRIIDQVTRQLYKLFPIIKIHNLTNIPSITRELILFKILTHELDRQKILEIASMFKASIVDCTSNIITLEVTGDSGKIVAIEQMLNKFGILEKVRTGKIGISRESISAGQLYTIAKDNLRRKLINFHVSEIEAKLYL